MKLRKLPADLVMEHGAHEPDGAMCLLEMTAWMAGEPWSYQPACTCPVLAAFGVALWDRWPADDLARLAPYAERLIGTRSTPAVELRRAYRAADWAVRRFASAALLSAGLEAEARKLQELSPIVDADTAAEAAARAAAARAAAAEAAEARAAAAEAAAAWAAEAAEAARAAAARAAEARAAAAEAAAAWAAEAAEAARAAAAAAWVAEAAAAAAAAEAARAAEAAARVWDLALLCLDDLLSVTETS